MSTITIGHIDECHYVSTTPLQSNASISMYNKSTTDIQSSINKHFIMSIYAISFSIIKSCTYWDSSTLQALHEHACLFYEKCDVHSDSKMPSIVTIYGADIEIVVSIPPHAVRTYIISRDIVINMNYPTWRVFTDDRTFGDEDRGLKEENQGQRRENQRNPRLRPRST